MCSLIVDGGSCANFTSTILVDKFALPIIDHPNPYTIHWFTNDVGIQVTKQVLVTFSIGKCENELLCDVVPMQTSQIILGRTWQFDKRVDYRGFSNSYSFKHKDGKITLTPLTRQQVHEDQLYLKWQYEEELARKKGKSAINLKVNERSRKKIKLFVDWASLFLTNPLTYPWFHSFMATL